MSLILYVYATDSNIVVMCIHGDSNAACERLAADLYGDDYGWTYTPAFGANDGLIYADVGEVQSC